MSAVLFFGPDFFNRSKKALPSFINARFVSADEFRIYTHQGQTLYHLGINNWKEKGLTHTSLDTLIRARTCLAKAAQIDPMHYLNTFWQTRTEENLEKAYAWLHPKKNNPYNAMPYYQKALSLRPSGITIRYAYARYLNSGNLKSKNLKTEIPDLVRYMMEIHPPPPPHTDT